MRESWLRWIRNFWRIPLFTAALLLALPLQAQEPLPAAFDKAPLAAATRGKLSRAIHGFGNEIKETFRDVKHDPVWALYVGGTVALNFTDLGTTCKGRSLGMPETNPLLPRYPSCAQLTAITIPVTVVHLTAMHKVREMFTESCRREAANPDSRWWKTPARTHDPENCKYAVPVAGMVAWPLHIRIIKNNLDDIEIYGRFRK